MSKIQLAEVKNLAGSIAAEHPDLRNPMSNDGVCLYIRRIDDHAPDSALRCFGGEILYRLKLRYPNEGKLVDTSPDADKLTKAAMQFLLNLQLTADNRENTTEVLYLPIKWGTVLDKLSYFNYDELDDDE